MGMLQSVSLFKPENSKLNELATQFLGNEDCYACVAVCNGRVIGFGSIFILKRIRGGRSAIIEDVVVHEDIRRKGVGRLIVKELLDHAITKSCFKVTLVAGEQNIPFYESLGFKEENRNMKLMF